MHQGVMGRMPILATGNRFISRLDLKGFTLLELIVALAVAGLLLATVPIALSRGYEASAYRATVRDLLAGLNAARHEAMRTGRETVFNLDLEGRRFGIGDRLNRSFAEALEVRFVVAQSDSAEQSRGSIRFYPDGSTTGGSIDLVRPSGDGTRLRVDWLLGKVSLYPLGS